MKVLISIRSIVFILCAVLIAAGVACSSRSATGGSASAAPSGSGAVGLDLTLPGGEHLSTIDYVLTNGAHTLNGSYNVAETSTLSFVIGSVPAGSGYSLSLNGISDDGTIACSFPAAGDAPTANITVVDRTTTIVNVNLQCLNLQGQDSGSVTVNAISSVCPVWNTIVVNPLNVTLDGGQNVDDSGTIGSTGISGEGANVPAVIQAGQQAVVVGSATAPNTGALTFTWTTNGGSLSSITGTIDPNSTDSGTTNQTIFTCPTTGVGTYTITLSLSDGPIPDGGGCDSKFTTGTVTVNCEAPPTCAFGTGCGDGGQICNIAGNCVPALFSVVVLQTLDGGAVDSVGPQLPVAIQEYNLTGATVGSPLQLPTAASGAQQPVTLMGNHPIEGDLTTSPNGQYLSFAGWNFPPGNATSQSGQPVVARIDQHGNIDTSTVLTGDYATGFSVRSAITDDGTGFWVSGAAQIDSPVGQGIFYAPFGSTSGGTQLVPLEDGVSSPAVSTRDVRIYGGSLFIDLDYAPPYLAQVGTGLPTSGTPTVSTLPGEFGTWSGPPVSPYSFLMFDLSAPSGFDTIYIADDGLDYNSGNSPSERNWPDNETDDTTNTGNGGISKWTYDSVSGWTQIWNITAGIWPADAGSLSGQPIGFRGMAGFATGTTVTIMATTADSQGHPDSLAVVLVDNGSATPPTPTIVATSPLNMVFRGVALTPQ